MQFWIISLSIKNIFYKMALYSKLSYRIKNINFNTKKIFFFSSDVINNWLSFIVKTSNLLLKTIYLQSKAGYNWFISLRQGIL